MTVIFYVQGFSIEVEEPTLEACVDIAAESDVESIPYSPPPPQGTWRVDQVDGHPSELPLCDVYIDGDPPTAEQAAYLDGAWPTGYDPQER